MAKMKTNTKSSRKDDEMKEGLETVSNDIGKDRFQDKQQIEEPVSTGQTIDAPQDSFNIKKIKTPGSQLKQEAVAKVISGTGGSGSGSMGIGSVLSGSNLKTLAYSGNEGNILGNSSGTPFVGSPSRSQTRPGQKLDAVAKEIDFVASEQAVQDFEGSKPLQANPNEVQGFLGHPENTYQRSQKASEGVPGALMYQRSVDEITKDKLVFTAGQHVDNQYSDLRISPTKTLVDRDVYSDFSITRSNYCAKNLRIGIRASDRKVVSICYDVDMLKSTTENAEQENEANTNAIQDMNLAEINRQRMESKAGIETESNWCGIVRAVEEPTQTVAFLTDDEIITGSEDWMAYRFVVKAWEYLMNKTAKDGQTPLRSFKEALYGYARTYVDSEVINGNDFVPFDAVDYLNGSPSLMIALYDSIAKYSKRGDLFTQPRGWKMHKQTADNNINQFRVKPEFVATVTGVDTFSTIDRGYDPLLPVNITDGFRTIQPYSYNDLCNKTGGTEYFGVADSAAGTANRILGAFNALNVGGKLTYKEILTGAPILINVANASTDVYSAKFGTWSHDKDARCGASYKFMFIPGDQSDGSFSNGAIGDIYPAMVEQLNLAHANSHNNDICYVYVACADVTGVGKEFRYLAYLPNIYANKDELMFALTPGVIAGVDYPQDLTDYVRSKTSGSAYAAPTLSLVHTPIEKRPFTYGYHNRQNYYVVQVRNPMLYGVAEWIEQMAGKLADVPVTRGSSSLAVAADARHTSHTGTADGIIWYTIPTAHYSRQMSLWSLILCASMPYQQKIRTNSQLDTLFYVDANGSYPYEQLISIGDANPLSSVNYTLNGLEKPLSCGIMKDSAAITWIMPEKEWIVSKNGDDSVKVGYWYESEDRYENGTSRTPSEEGYVMNYPTTRAGARWSFLDKLYGMTERDIRLCLDRRIRKHHSDGDGYAYKYSTASSGTPTFVRTEEDTQWQYLSSPRELGWFMDAPLGYVTPALNIVATSDGDLYDSKFRRTITPDNTAFWPMSLGSSHKIRTWKVRNSSAEYPDILDAAATVTVRAGNFEQRWAEMGDGIYLPYLALVDSGSVYGYTGFKIRKGNDIGVAVCSQDELAFLPATPTLVAVDGETRFQPFTSNTTTQAVGSPHVISLQKLLWTRLQVLPFAINPFELNPQCLYNETNQRFEAIGAANDPFDFLYFFGFCGYKASDFREDVFNRIYEKQNLGWLYVKNPFVEASPVLRDGGLHH